MKAPEISFSNLGLEEQGAWLFGHGLDTQNIYGGNDNGFVWKWLQAFLLGTIAVGLALLALALLAEALSQGSQEE